MKLKELKPKKALNKAFLKVKPSRPEIEGFKTMLTPRELEIFELRVFSDSPATLQEIGDRYGISRERIRQVEKNIVKKMREFFKNELPDFASYLEDSLAE